MSPDDDRSWSGRYDDPQVDVDDPTWLRATGRALRGAQHIFRFSQEIKDLAHFPAKGNEVEKAKISSRGRLPQRHVRR